MFIVCDTCRVECGHPATVLPTHPDLFRTPNIKAFNGLRIRASHWDHIYQWFIITVFCYPTETWVYKINVHIVMRIYLYRPFRFIARFINCQICEYLHCTQCVIKVMIIIRTLQNSCRESPYQATIHEKVSFRATFSNCLARLAQNAEQHTSFRLSGQVSTLRQGMFSRHFPSGIIRPLTRWP